MRRLTGERSAAIASTRYCSSSMNASNVRS
jgi:hypothetical protein